MQIDDLPPLRDVIAAHGLDAKKSLGQNFLLDLNLTSKISRLVIKNSWGNWFHLIKYFVMHTAILL